MNAELIAKAAAIDWAPLQKYPLDAVTCECGTVYLSHTKGIAAGGEFTVATQTPCPSCNKTIGHVRAAHSEPERQVIGGGRAR